MQLPKGGGIVLKPNAHKCKQPMTEQEKQAIRDDINYYTPCTDRESALEDYAKALLVALDERDREVERLESDKMTMMYEYESLVKDFTRLRKALEEIADAKLHWSESQEIARQALVVEEK